MAPIRDLVASVIVCLLLGVATLAPAQERILIRSVGVAVGGYAIVGEMREIAAAAVGGGGRLAVGNGTEAGLVGLVDTQGLLFFPEPHGASLSGVMSTVGGGYRWSIPAINGVSIGLHFSYGVLLLRVDGTWGNTAFNGAWHAGQVGAADLDVEVPVGARFAFFLQPRYIVTPELGFFGHLVGGQLGVRYLW